MIRLIGAILLLTSGAYCAYGTMKKEKKKLSVTDAWIELLYYVRTQIDCFSTPLPEILKKADRSFLCATESQDAPLDAQQLVESTAPLLNKECQKLLRDWAREIGTTFREEQIKRCDYYLHALEKQRDQIKETLPMRIKMLTTLHLCATLGAVILLW